MATVRGQIATDDQLSDLHRVQVGKRIARLDPDASPLTVLTKRIKGRTQPVPGKQFSWFEKDRDPKFDAVNGALNNSATAVVVDNAEYFAPEDVVLVTATGERFRVTAVNEGTQTLTVIRGLNSTAQAIDDNAEILKIGSAAEEGDVSKVPTYRAPVKKSNYTQIFRTPWSMTRTEIGTEYETVPEGWADLANEKGVEHMIEIERAALHGTPVELTHSGDSHPTRYTGGFYHFVTTNVTDAGGGLTQAELFDFVGGLFRHGSRKIALGSRSVISIINTFALNNIQTATNERQYGVNVTKLITPHGQLQLAAHDLLEGAEYGEHLVVIDLDAIAYRPFKGADTHLRKNIQEPDRDGRKDEYLTEAGFQFENEKKHGYMTGITSAA